MRHIFSACILMALSTPLVHAQPGIRMIGQPVFYPHGSYITQLSDDGRTAMGRFSSPTANGSTYFKYSVTGGYQEFPQIPAYSSYTVTDMSSDSSVEIGTVVYNDLNGNEVVRGYHLKDGIRTIIEPPIYYETLATAVSRNGLYVTGVIPAGNYYRSFRWSAARGTEILPAVQRSAYIVDPHEISDNGDIILYSEGFHSLGFGARYNSDGTLQIIRPQPTSYDFNTFANIITRDGDLVYGHAYEQGVYELVRWDRQLNMTILGHLEGYDRINPKAGSDDGSIIVGTASGLPPSVPFVWSATEGWFTITDYLAHHNIPIPSGWTIDYLASVSGDGRTFGGQIVHPTLGKVAFTATVPSPAIPTILLAAGLLAIRRRRDIPLAASSVRSWEV